MTTEREDALKLMRDKLAEYVAWADDQGDTLLAIHLGEVCDLLEQRARSRID
jgi:hypothetical protein